MTASSLRALSRKALTVHAKKCQIAGWHDMTKDELVTALAAFFRRQRANHGASRGRSRNGLSASTNGNGSTNGKTMAESAGARQRTLGGGHLNGRRLLKPATSGPAPAVCDSLVAEAHDPCWIHVRWTLSRATLARAEAALGMQWHRAIPILRIFDVTADDARSSAQTRLRDVEIHGDVDHWYLPVEHSPRAYKVQIGYRAPSGLFFVMASSNRVATPRPGSHSLHVREQSRHRVSASGSASRLDLEKKPSYDLRALTTTKRTDYDTARRLPVEEDAEAAPPDPIELSLHAELIVHGMTDPHAELTLLGDRIPVSRDGTFSHRLSLEEGRQVIDAVVTTKNGCHQRTIVLGIERNTKVLEPQWFEGES